MNSIKQNANQINANKDFMIPYDDLEVNKIELAAGTYVTNCLTCNRTCHFPCSLPNNADKSKCNAMIKENCSICPKKCHWSEHFNDSHRFECKTIKKTKRADDMHKAY